MTFTSSGRGAPCGRCLVALDPDTIAVRSARGPPPAQSVRWLHPECAVDVDTRALCERLRSDPLFFRGRAVVEALAVTRERLIAQRAMAQWRDRHEDTGHIVEIPPSRSLEDAALLRPARDPRGRPRVRVILWGAAVCALDIAARAFWWLLHKGYSWRSPKREHVFALPEPRSLE